MKRTQMIIVAVMFGAAFAVSGILRGDAAPGLVGGALGGVLVFLVLLRVTEHNDGLRRRRDEHRRREG